MKIAANRSRPRSLTARTPRQNISRRAAERRRRRWLGRLTAVAGSVTGAALAVFTSLFFVFVYDVLTQTDYLRARHIHIESGPRVRAQTLTEVAGVHADINLLSVNLSAARRRLLAHPWVAEAVVHWEIPSSLYLRVREHEPVAIIDLGKKFLLNRNGEIFKEWEPADPADLPVVRGLHLSDLRLVDRSGTAAPLAWPWVQFPAPATDPSRPMESVLEVLALAAARESALPLREIRTIQVDRELGLTVIADNEGPAVRLGYDEYDAKLRLLAELTAFIKTQPGLSGFQRIDLTDMNRVIVNPVRAETAARTSPKGG
jgi:cell division protein FtsQ